MVRYSFTCSYDGFYYKGWQRQPHGQGVQNYIEKACSGFFDTTIKVLGCSRTDSGVHAEGQVFHLDISEEYSPEKLILELNYLLPKTIRLTGCRMRNSDFHAQLSSTGKRYRYQISRDSLGKRDRKYWYICQDLDLDLMKKAAFVFQGTHDFFSFGGNHDQAYRETTVKTIREIRIEENGQKIYIFIEGDSFLYKMARRMVGAIVDIGRKRLGIEELDSFLTNRERTARILTASSNALFLEEVFY